MEEIKIEENREPTGTHVSLFAYFKEKWFIILPLTIVPLLLFVVSGLPIVRGLFWGTCGDGDCKGFALAYLLVQLVSWIVTLTSLGLLVLLLFNKKYKIILIMISVIAVPQLILFLFRPGISSYSPYFILSSFTVNATWYEGSLQVLMMFVYGFTLFTGIIFKRTFEKLLQIEIVLYIFVIIMQIIFPEIMSDLQKNIERSTISRPSRLPYGYLYYTKGMVVNNKEYIYRLSSDGKTQSIELPDSCSSADPRGIIISSDNRRFVCGRWLVNIDTGDKKIFDINTTLSSSNKYHYFKTSTTNFSVTPDKFGNYGVETLHIYRYGYSKLEKILSVDGSQYYGSTVLYAETPHEDKVAVFILPFIPNLDYYTTSIIVIDNGTLTQKILDVGCCYTVVKETYAENTGPKWSLDGNKLFYALSGSDKTPGTKFVLHNSVDNSETSIDSRDMITNAIYNGKDSVYYIVCKDLGSRISGSCSPIDGGNKLYRLDLSTKHTTFLKNLPATYAFNFLMDGEWIFYDGFIEKTEDNKKLRVLNDFHDFISWNR